MLISTRLLAFVSIFSTGNFLAQTSPMPVPTLIDAATATGHGITRQNQSMPPIARAAHVFGNVEVQLVIDTSGRVVSATALSGPDMLKGDALDTTRAWTYKPFMQQDQPIAVTTVVKLLYNEATPGPHGPHPSLDNFFAAQSRCAEATHAKSAPQKIAKSCGDDLTIQADALPSNNPIGYSKMAAYLKAADAFLHNGQFREARQDAGKAIPLVEQGNADLSSACTAYFILAEAELGEQNMASGNTDLTKSEDAERTAMAIVQSEPLKKEYARILKTVLNYHARILAETGSAADAKAKIDEAAVL